MSVYQCRLAVKKSPPSSSTRRSRASRANAAERSSSATRHTRAFDCNLDAMTGFAAAHSFGNMLFAQKGAHLAKDFRLSVNETNVIRIGEHDRPAVWNLSAE